MLGFKDAPRCADCLAKGLDRVRNELIASVKQHVDHRECWSAGWRHAGTIEQLRAAPACRVASVVASSAPAAAARSNPPVVASDHAACYDAGDLGCGDLVLELRMRLRELAPGSLLEVIARDPGAPADLPAWCGMTGHTLVSANHPRYLIRRRKE